MSRNLCLPCDVEFSRGRGSGVAEAIGNWGFSNRTCSSGQELNRLKCIFAKMDCLRTPKPMLFVRYDRRNDPEAWKVKPSPHECKPQWTFPVRRPFIVYNSVAETRLVSNLNEVAADLLHIIPGLTYALQGTEKFYRRGPDCCPQPSCLAPQCSKPCCT